MYIILYYYMANSENEMTRKLVCFLWTIVIITAFYIMLTVMVGFNGRKGRVVYMHGIDAFYRDIGMRGFDRNLLFRESVGAHNAINEMIFDQSIDKDLQYIQDVANNVKVKEVEKVSSETDILSNNSSINITERRQAMLEKIAAEKKLAQQYYQLRNMRINPFNFKFVETGEHICDTNEVPYLVILCLTKYYDVETREAIRETWGSVAKTRKWPSVRFEIPIVKLVFLLGDPGDSLVKNTIIRDEKNRFGDIVAGGFKDTYSNLTLKVMMGLKWVTKYCPKAKYVVKIDQDTFLHVVNLINYLSLSFMQIPKQGVIIGYQNKAPKVLRTGRWSVERSRFPMNNYPNYTNGNCYVISGNVVGDIFEAAERMPYVTVEDAFITGIVRTTLGIDVIHHKGFTQWNDKPPRLCGFHNHIRIAATNADDDKKRKLWKALGYRNLKNCYNLDKNKER